MNNNTAILNCLSKQLFLKFEDKYFIVNLAEGDLEDSWNTIQFSDKTSLDINFTWEDTPIATLYGLTYDSENDVYNVNLKERYPIKINFVFGNKADYLSLEFNDEIGVNTYRIFSGAKMIKRTTSLDIASDFVAKSIIIDKLVDVHIVGMDKYGATKVIEIEEKYNIFYKIQEKSKQINNYFDSKDIRVKYDIK